MRLPIIITNFKLYPNATGAAAVALARLHEKVALEMKVNLAVAVQAVDLRSVAAAVKIPVFAQHFDPVLFGAGTGRILPEALLEAGAVGSLLNHSEFQLPMGAIERAVEHARAVGLKIVCCAQDNDEAAQVAAFGPDMVAIEPPELIGGDVSISTAKPEVIRAAMESVGRGKVIVGAGIKTGEDVRIALALGASGVLLSSGVTKAVDPEAVLRDLAWGMSAAPVCEDSC